MTETETAPILLFTMNEYTIMLTWDNEASVWIAECDDIPGLILESASFDTLVERVKIAIPDLLEQEGCFQAKLHYHCGQ